MRSRSRWNGVRSEHSSGSARALPAVSYERTASVGERVALEPADAVGEGVCDGAGGVRHRYPSVPARALGYDRDMGPIGIHGECQLADGDALAAGDFSAWLAGMQAALRGRARRRTCPAAAARPAAPRRSSSTSPPTRPRRSPASPKELLFPAPLMPEGHVVLGHDERGHCPMLVDGRCSIYADRPRTCRTYDCRVFAATGHRRPSDGLIAERARALAVRSSVRGRPTSGARPCMRPRSSSATGRRSCRTAQRPPTRPSTPCSPVEMHERVASDDDGHGAAVDAPGGAGDVGRAGRAQERDHDGDLLGSSPSAPAAGRAPTALSTSSRLRSESRRRLVGQAAGRRSTPASASGPGRRRCSGSRPTRRVGHEPREREHRRLRDRVVRHARGSAACPTSRRRSRWRLRATPAAPAAPPGCSARGSSRSGSTPRCQSSSVSCSNVAIRAVPTLFTSTSRPPSAVDGLGDGALAPVGLRQVDGDRRRADRLGGRSDGIARGDRDRRALGPQEPGSLEADAVARAGDERAHALVSSEVHDAGSYDLRR